MLEMSKKIFQKNGQRTGLGTRGTWRERLIQRGGEKEGLRALQWRWQWRWLWRPRSAPPLPRTPSPRAPRNSPDEAHNRYAPAARKSLLQGLFWSNHAQVRWFLYLCSFLPVSHAPLRKICSGWGNLCRVWSARKPSLVRTAGFIRRRFLVFEIHLFTHANKQPLGGEIRTLAICNVSSEMFVGVLLHLCTNCCILAPVDCLVWSCPVNWAELKLDRKLSCTCSWISSSSGTCIGPVRVEEFTIWGVLRPLIHFRVDRVVILWLP